jgi:hypothetical protein
MRGGGRANRLHVGGPFDPETPAAFQGKDGRGRGDPESVVGPSNQHVAIIGETRKQASCFSHESIWIADGRSESFGSLDPRRQKCLTQVHVYPFTIRSIGSKYP